MDSQGRVRLPNLLSQGKPSAGWRARSFLTRGFFHQGKPPSKKLSKALTRSRVVVLLFAIWIVAIVLPTLRFGPGDRTLLQLERLQGKPSLGIEILLATIGICLLVSISTLGILGIRSIWRRRRKREEDYFLYRENPPTPWSVYAMITLLLVGLGSVIWLSLQHADHSEPLMGDRQSVETSHRQSLNFSPLQSSTLERRRPVTPAVPFPMWRIPLILGLLFLLGLSLKYFLQGKPQGEGLGLQQVAEPVPDGTKDLERSTEPSDFVLGCYRDMCKILGRKVTLTRDLTAREFTKLLLQAGIREREVARLTELFEGVRYGHRISGPNEQAEALALLKTIEERYGGEIHK